MSRIFGATPAGSVTLDARFRCRASNDDPERQSATIECWPFVRHRRALPVPVSFDDRRRWDRRTSSLRVGRSSAPGLSATSHASRHSAGQTRTSATRLLRPSPFALRRGTGQLLLLCPASYRRTSGPCRSLATIFNVLLTCGRGPTSRLRPESVANAPKRNR